MRVQRAPAKLNLGLRILGRRPDGYHLLESVFVPVGLADAVEVRLGPPQGSGLESDRRQVVDFRLDWAPDAEAAPEVPSNSENLAARAAVRFAEAAGLGGAIRVDLLKRIPAGAGLGGGSSDAGAVLRALQALRPDALSEEELASIALELGADVPYFLAPGPALVTGIGERITPLPVFPELWILLVNPGIPLATADVFRAWDAGEASLTPIEPGSTMRALSGLEAGPDALNELFDAGLLLNDLEPASLRLCPSIGNLLERIRSLGARWSGMSGSGASVYGIFPDEKAALAALEEADFRAPIWARVVCCPGCGQRSDPETRTGEI